MFFNVFANALQEYKDSVCGLGNRRKDGTEFTVKERLGGMGAEYAVGRILGACPLLSMDLRGDSGVDLTLADSRTLDIKYRHKRGWDFALRTTNPDELKADYAVLVWPGQEKLTVDIVGALGRDEFLWYAEVDNFGYGDRLIVRYDKFKPIESVFPGRLQDNHDQP